VPTNASRLRRGVVAVALAGALTVLSGCGWFSSDEEPTVRGTATSVFDVQPGQCFNPPGEVKTENSEIPQVACDQPHTMESYALVDYTQPDGGAADAYPGNDALTTFADGACAEEFTGYVGVSYQDSSLFFTYLLPSARSWELNSDRKVICFVTTTGQQLTASVAGSKL
jgi:Septum formation